MRHALDASELEYDQQQQIQQQQYQQRPPTVGGGQKRPQSAKQNQYYYNNKVDSSVYSHQNNNNVDLSYQQQRQNYSYNQQVKPPQVNNYGLNNNKKGSLERQQLPSTRQPKNNNYLNTSHESGNPNNVSNIQDFKRQIPKNITVDKERLYAETLQLKNVNNSIQKENQMMKAKIQQLEKNCSRLERILDQGQSTGQISQKEGGNQFLVSSLKKQIKDYQSEVNDYKDQLQTLKKNIKVTKLQEIETEKQAYENESNRLRTMLEQSMKQKMQVMIQEEDYHQLEDKCYQQDQLINQLKSDNGELAQILKELEEREYSQQMEIQDLKTKFQNETNNLKRQLKQKEKDFQNLKQRQQYIQPVRNSGQKESSRSPQRFNKNDNQDQKILKQNLKQKDEKIQELQDQLELLQQQQQQYQYQNQDNQQSDRNKFNVQENSQQQQYNLIPTIKVEEIQHLGQEIKFKLQAQAITWNQLINDKFQDQQEHTIYEDLQIILQEEPFYLDSEMGQILGRYLIEGDDQENIEDRPQRSESNQIITERLQALVKEYKVWDENEAKDLFNSLENIIDDNKYILETTFEMYCSKEDKTLMTLEKFQYSFEQCSIQLSQDEFDFLVSGIILDCEGINKLIYGKIFEVFQKIPQQQNDDEQSESYDKFYESNNTEANQIQNNQQQNLKYSKNSAEENQIIDQYLQDDVQQYEDENWENDNQDNQQIQEEEDQDVYDDNDFEQINEDGNQKNQNNNNNDGYYDEDFE